MNKLPVKLEEWQSTTGEYVRPEERNFIKAVRKFASKGVGYGFMQCAVEMIWNEVLPGHAWGPEYFSGEMSKLQAEIKTLKKKKGS